MSIPVLKKWSTLQVTRQSQGIPRICTSCCSRLFSSNVVQENDIVLLRRKGDTRAAPILTPPLGQAGEILTARGCIEKASLIGKGIRSSVTTSKGAEYRIHWPTLGEYVRFTPRKVTPIYPQDAELIVSLLDLHPDTYSREAANMEPFEVFEAGTGHGSLTLHLARAIHGTNPPAPQLPLRQPIVKTSVSQNASSTTSSEMAISTTPVTNVDAEHTSGTNAENAAVNEAYEAYLPTRRAIIQTLDISPGYSAHAQITVRNFRQGLYYPNINFHTGTITEYLSSRLAHDPRPFLAHAFLDLPGPHKYLEIVSKALKPNGILLIFCPSITQIIKCVETLKAQSLPFLLESTLELGSSGGSGGREWDVKFVKPRALIKAQAESLAKSVDAEESDTAATEYDDGEVETPEKVKSTDDSGWEVVCRPKVGLRLNGGGFLGLFRRMDMQLKESV